MIIFKNELIKHQIREAYITTQLAKDMFIQEWHSSNVAQALISAESIADYCAANAHNIDYNGAFPKSEFEKIAAANLLIAPLSRELSKDGWGAGFDSSVTYELLMLLKHIGRGNLAVGRIYEGHINAVQLIQTFGSQEQIAGYAIDVCNYDRIFGVWNAEAADGVKIIPLSNGKYQLQGSKTFCSGAGYVQRPFVNGALPDGSWQMCIVPMDEVKTISNPDWWQPLGMRATASYKIDFTGVELNDSALIGQPGDYYRQPWLSLGVIRFAAVQLGGAEALFNYTRQYLQQLEYTKDPYQQERLGRMAIAIESGNLWLRGAADMVTAYAPVFGGYPTFPQQPERIVTYANMVRTAIEQICIDVIQLCERCVGTRGLLPPHPMERIIRDLTLYLRQPAFDAALSNAGQYVLSSKESVLVWSNE